MCMSAAHIRREARKRESIDTQHLENEKVSKKLGENDIGMLAISRQNSSGSSGSSGSSSGSSDGGNSSSSSSSSSSSATSGLKPKVVPQNG